jgi:acetyl-CoA C-acetyltransferase
MRDVYVAGVGLTEFGRQPQRGVRELAEEAVHKALLDARKSPKDLQGAWVGNVTSGLRSGQLSALGQMVMRGMGVGGIPVARVENACASGSTAVREAYLAVAHGELNVSLAIGAESLTPWSTTQMTEIMARASDAELEAPLGLTFPAVFGMIARRHADLYGTTSAELAAVAVKAHRNGALNPIAQFDSPIEIEDVLNARRVASPLGILDCCPISDGAAAVVLVAKEFATSGAPRMAASALSSGAFRDDSSLTDFQATRDAAQRCYAQAGIAAKDIDVAEVHDCFTIAEIIHCEDLGLCERGAGGSFAASGATAIGGDVAVNSSGGLKARGHPVGATGVAQVAELTIQLRGEAGERQVPQAEVGVAHTLGGFVHGDAAACAMHVLIRD